jgi:chloramphenicol-sensitive protein RarD
VTAQTEATRGFAAAVSAFLIWGFLPIYLKALSVISPLEIMVHRALWCCVFVMGWLASRSALSGVMCALSDRNTRWRLALSAVLISINWFVYVFAVNSGHVIETSLGYFINPLVNVLLGVAVLRERLNPWQWLAVSCAAIGVAYLTWITGRLPWISLALACSFGLYGLIRKMVSVDAVIGLASETLLIFPFGLLALGWLAARDQLAFGDFGWHIDLLLIAGGVLTAVPLALFAYGARLIPYSTIGLIQYLAPTLQLALGVWAYHEPMSRARLLGFCMIWLALLIYAADGLRRSRAVALATR